jgi:hypothetical protein
MSRFQKPSLSKTEAGFGTFNSSTMVLKTGPVLRADTNLLTGANASLQILEIQRGHLNPVANATLAVDLEDGDVASLLVSPPFSDLGRR